MENLKHEMKEDLKQKNEYEEKLKRFADDLEQRIQMLKNKRSEVEAEAVDKYDQLLTRLEKNLGDAEAQYKLAKSSSEEVWENLSQKANDKAKEISSEVDEAYSGIKNGFGYLYEKVIKS
jgi:predicted  nucleic acid-binding Zn-ribbon protein